MMIKKVINLKEINHKIWTENFDNDSQRQLDYGMLNNLYSLHRIAYSLLENDIDIQEKILKAIKKEQVKLEKKRYDILIRK